MTRDPLPKCKKCGAEFYGFHKCKEVEPVSNLLEHAKRELQAAGLYDKDADYGGLIPQAVLALVAAHVAQGHSGGSHEITMQIFNKVVNFQPLTALTDDPAEWMSVDDKLWQSRRQPDAFSLDGGKTWYSVNDEHRGIHKSASK